MHSRKGQAAMEFLMTYGWAILVVLAAIGALAYFGILSPGNFLPSSFTMSSGISAGEFKLDSSGNLTLGFINSMGVGIKVLSVYVNTSSASAPLDCNDEASQTIGGLNVTQPNGVSKSYYLDCSSTGTPGGNVVAEDEGKKFKAAVRVIYVKDGETVTHTATGDLTTKVEVV